MASHDPRDPGWWPAARILPKMWIPGLGLRTISDRSKTAVTLMRALYCSFMFAYVVMLGVVWLLTTRDVTASFSTTTASAIVAGVAVVADALVLLMNRRPLRGDSLIAAVGAYRTMMFLELGVAQIPVLLGFALTFLTQTVTPYAVGLICALPALLLAAPSGNDLERRQEQLRNRGSSIDLVGALVEQPAGGEGPVT